MNKSQKQITINIRCYLNQAHDIEDKVFVQSKGSFARIIEIAKMIQKESINYDNQ